MNITLWTLIGGLGALLFAGRWVLQVVSSHYRKMPVVPVGFWYMSAVGNILMLLYFVFGARDLVGIISNLFPLLVAAYNIFLLKRATVYK